MLKIWRGFFVFRSSRRYEQSPVIRIDANDLIFTVYCSFVLQIKPDGFSAIGWFWKFSDFWSGMFPLIFLSHFINFVACDQKSELQHLKIAASDPMLFWFGKSWKIYCDNLDRKNLASLIFSHIFSIFMLFFVKFKLQCSNSQSLKPFESLAARILRVTTFDQAYLQNLKFLPKMMFRAEAGFFRTIFDEQISLFHEFLRNIWSLRSFVWNIEKWRNLRCWLGQKPHFAMASKKFAWNSTFWQIKLLFFANFGRCEWKTEFFSF